MNKVLIEKARKFVESECRKPTNKYGYGLYVEHFVPMQNHAKKLCHKLAGNPEIISIAAWLHDIDSMMIGRKDHHLTSARIARDFLEKQNYDPQKTTIVLACIEHHRQSTSFNRETLEEKIIADADAICNFDMLPGLFYVTLVVEKLTPILAAKSIKKKLENKWRRLHFNESKKLVKPKYQATMLLSEEITKP